MNTWYIQDFQKCRQKSEEQFLLNPHEAEKSKLKISFNWRSIEKHLFNWEICIL